ncbi:type I DNA topoisomerase [Buchnera aphidicola (Macrosiphoniella sanborni)]|uniref:DNA topoisomerase 1 n=1 Tax=Buchnera aphidicola (Macrosiphoniella sanborni) TaxID=1241865 RepID=A0A4D6Y2L9_9GAMM|nr:type I DNA topoisomerase [Buchnera aphidicola]QCI23822.1 type I DNA topoisomerase [Buchnera aphidicola (Macrosiphoniella sanborni)]
MSKSLVIVESPAKAKTINKYLGHEYIVKSSIGHIRDLITNKLKNQYKNNIKTKKNPFLKNSKKNFFIKNIGIDPHNNWKAEYYILPGKEKIISELKNIAREVDHIYLATDLDREGEAIAWHLKEVIGGDISKFSRVVFNEITQHSIEKAFKNVIDINMNQVYAQQARRFMDRIVGYMISPLLWKKISKGLSAGRVQSVAVRIIAERENIIKNFISEEYWKVYVSFLFKDKHKIIMDITHFNNKKFYPKNKNEVNLAIDKIKQSSFFIKKLEKKIIYEEPPVPFITSTLQQSSSLSLGFSVKKTMFLAQKLYEEGYITYIRTDSYYLSNYALKKARVYIQEQYGKNYLPKKFNIHINKKSSQKAHEAIRPSNIEIQNINSNILNADAKKLYRLIWKQFISSQMKSAKYQSINIIIQSNLFKLQKKIKIILYDGWTKIFKKNNETIFKTSMFNVGHSVLLDEIIINQKFTKPLPRFTEASLVRELEKKGIGRPSTYSFIVSKIQERGYVKIKNNKFYAEKIGEILTVRLKKSFSNLVDYNFTANMEKKLDQIAENKLIWTTLLNNFFKDFSIQLEKAKKLPEEGGMELNTMVLTSIECSYCFKKMGIKNAITGVFLSCSGYNNSELKKRCKNTIDLVLIEDDLVIENNIKEVNYKKTKLHSQSINKCEKCHMFMNSYFINEKMKLHICTNNPSCIGYKIETGNFNSPLYLTKIVECEKCHSNMTLKIGRFGKFFICINQKCKNTRKILPNGDISPPKIEPIPFPELLCTKSNAWFVLREGISGIFFAANNFPKSRETRSPFVEELAKFQHLLPKKIHYLSTAPIRDDQENKTIVCFNRKNQEYYVASKKKGKFTGWSAIFRDNKWYVLNK